MLFPLNPRHGMVRQTALMAAIGFLGMSYDTDQSFYKPLFARQAHHLSYWALEDFEASLDRHGERWRVPYVAAITLLRSIGHVVSKVDGERDKAVRRVLNDHWSTWKQDEIFQRLDDNRNHVLKEFKFGLGRASSHEQDTLQDNLVFLDGTPKDALNELRRIWHWWDEILTEVERKSGRISPDERAFLAYRALGQMRF